MLALTSKLGMIAGVLAVSSGVASASTLISSPARLDSFETIDVAPRVFAYRLAGDFSETGQSVDAPLVAVARLHLRLFEPGAVEPSAGDGEPPQHRGDLAAPEPEARLQDHRRLSA